MARQLGTSLVAAAKLFVESFRHPNTDKRVVIRDHQVTVENVDGYTNGHVDVPRQVGTPV
ncbi:MAG TPA: hypothetical protein VKU86_00100 [Acidimicrobiales bacterium]|nr:hypothetical protein [Acidimicrobiales bacterium]